MSFTCGKVGTNSILLGIYSNTPTPLLGNTISIGNNAGNLGQGGNAIAIGFNAGANTQGGGGGVIALLLVSMQECFHKTATA